MLSNIKLQHNKNHQFKHMIRMLIIKNNQQQVTSQPIKGTEGKTKVTHQLIRATTVDNQDMIITRTQIKVKTQTNPKTKMQGMIRQVTIIIQDMIKIRLRIKINLITTNNQTEIIQFTITTKDTTQTKVIIKIKVITIKVGSDDNILKIQ